MNFNYLHFEFLYIPKLNLKHSQNLLVSLIKNFFKGNALINKHIF